MKEIILNRYYSDSYCTLGIFSIKGVEDPIFHTIEKPWLGNAEKISCIPVGSYICKPWHSKKFVNCPDIWEITNVPNRTAVLIHVANRAEQLEGCIAVGLSAGYMQYKDTKVGLGKAVHESSQAIRQMKNILGYPSEFKLTIL